MRFGITEQGDASMDFSWENALREKEVEGAILITKRLSHQFIEKVVECHNDGLQMIIHATCTGFGQTKLEPNAFSMLEQLTNLEKLLEAGFPKERCVLRIDPVFPTDRGLRKFTEVLEMADSIFDLDKAKSNQMRVRISVADEYMHVKERYKQNGFNPMYEGVQASDKQFNQFVELLGSYNKFMFRTCAEEILVKMAKEKGYSNVIAEGCISAEDLKLFGISLKQTSLNPQKRKGRLCLSCKTEILKENGCYRCPIGCLYCYWHDRPLIKKRVRKECGRQRVSPVETYKEKGKIFTNDMMCEMCGVITIVPDMTMQEWNSCGD